MDTSKRTPWGMADYREQLSPDVALYVTPSHGGFQVTGDSLARIPEEHRVGFAGQIGWYEEDCDWAVVAHYLPELFTADQREDARLTIQHWHPCGLVA